MLFFEVPPIYSLDCTDVTKWDSCILEPAVAIISALMRGEKPEQRPLNENFQNQKTTDSSTNTHRYCEVIMKWQTIYFSMHSIKIVIKIIIYIYNYLNTFFDILKLTSENFILFYIQHIYSKLRCANKNRNLIILIYIKFQKYVEYI